MNKLENNFVEKFSVEFAIILNALLLAVHVGLFFGFWYFGVYLMVYVNIASILIYVFGFTVAKNNRMIFFALVLIEVLAHLIVATMALGWDYGFHLYCMALFPMVYYTDYIVRRVELIKIYPRITSAVIMLIYTSLKLYTTYYQPFYDLQRESLMTTMYIINAVIAMAFILFLLNVFYYLINQSEAIIKEYASTDILTGLNNRSKMIEIQDSYFKKNMKEGEEALVAIMDIDDFKQINDRHGHLVGDHVLKFVAGELEKIASDNFHICRWGGEEFLIFAYGDNIYNQAVDRLSEFVKSIKESVLVHEDLELSTTVTIGLVKRQEQEKINILIRKADEKLYYGKHNGKNQLVI